MTDFLRRILPPGLLAAVLLAADWEFLPPVEHAAHWKQLGLLLPTLWLASIGPRGLELRGGLLMWIFRYNPGEADKVKRLTRMRRAASLVALLWLAAGLLCGWRVSAGVGSSFWAGALYAGLYAGILACLGVFTLLALTPEQD